MNTPKPNWLLTTGLIFLTLVPSIAGTLRIIGLATGGPVNPENARFYAMPIPVVVHIISALVYCLVGALQFAPVRRQNITWHRRAGRVLAVAGIAAAISGLWMTVFYPLPAQLQGPLLYGVRLLIGASMIFSITQAWIAIRRKDVPSHRAWMIRGYALGQGAGTQVFVMIPAGILLGGNVSGLLYDILMTAAWLINLLVAEWIIRRKASNPSKGARRVVASVSSVELENG